MKLDALGRRARTDNLAPTGKKIRLTDNDRAILNLLRRYRWLPSTYIIALLGRDANSVQHRLTDLRKELGLIFCPSESWGHDKKTQPIVYGLTPLGEKLAGKAEKFGNKIKHDLLTCLTMASMEIGAIENGLPVIEWDELKQSDHCTTQNWKLPLRGGVLEPDFPPRAIGMPRYYFYGVEIDRDTETGEGEAHKTLTRMFEDYFEVIETQAGKKLGMPRFLIPIITINNTRLRQMLDILKTVAGDRKTENFIFKVVPDILTEFWDFPKPSGAIFTEDWITTKGTFNLLSALKGEAHGRTEARTDNRTKEATG